MLLKVLSISRLVFGAVWFTIGDSRGPAAPDEQLSGESLQFALNEVTLPGRNTLALQTCNDRVEDMPYSNDVLPVVEDLPLRVPVKCFEHAFR